VSGFQAQARKGGQWVYGLALRALYARAGLPWEVNGHVVRIHPAVRHLVPHISEPEVDEVLHTVIGEATVVLDVGSFVGIHAILAARKAGSSGRVIAIEPTRASAEIARRHFAYNGLGEDRVRVIEAAVSDRAGRMTFHEYDLPYVNSLARAADTARPAVDRLVDVVTIDDVCIAAGEVPTVIRMDVQGAEIHALLGARETIRRAGSSLVLIVEMHPQCWPAFGITESFARETIRRLGLLAKPLVPGQPLFGRDCHAILKPCAGEN
jgi:FkbM family methyltransferase